jgi:hypothetical protein
MFMPSSHAEKILIGIKKVFAGEPHPNAAKPCCAPSSASF